MSFLCYSLKILKLSVKVKVLQCCNSCGNFYIQVDRGLFWGADGEYLLKGIFSTNVVGGYI